MDVKVFFLITMLILTGMALYSTHKRKPIEPGHIGLVLDKTAYGQLYVRVVHFPSEDDKLSASKRTTVTLATTTVKKPAEDASTTGTVTRSNSEITTPSFSRYVEDKYGCIYQGVSGGIRCNRNFNGHRVPYPGRV